MRPTRSGAAAKGFDASRAASVSMKKETGVPDGREAGMEGREERRDRTFRYGDRARRVHLEHAHPDCAIEGGRARSAWRFAKAKSVGCRCRRRARGGSPKLCGWMNGYHQTVVERIAGHRLARAWVRAVRAAEPDDVEL
jgi:hypothetical protein